jgi:hypothetical protein
MASAPTAGQKPGYREFTAKRGNGMDSIKLSVRNPTQKEEQYANMEGSAAFNRGLESGLPVRQRILRKLRDNGLWGDEQQGEYEQRQEELRAAELMVANVADRKAKLQATPDSPEKTAELDKLDSHAEAAGIARTRAQEKFGELQEEFEQMTSQTADARANSARRNALIACVIEHADGPNKGKRLFGSVDELLGSNDRLLLERIGYEFNCCTYNIPSEWDALVEVQPAAPEVKSDDKGDNAVPADQVTLKDPTEQAFAGDKPSEIVIAAGAQPPTVPPPTPSAPAAPAKAA